MDIKKKEQHQNAVGYLRLHQIIGNKNTNPPVPPLIPISKSTWWAGVKSGRFPKAVKLSARTTAWRAEDIEALISKIDNSGTMKP